jgi:hypothetical protein
MRFENSNSSSIIAVMLTRRFALEAVFIVLALAGGTGAVMESGLQEGERCPACESTAYPAAKASLVHYSVAAWKSYHARHIIRMDLSYDCISSALPCTHNVLDSHFQVLLI